MRLAQIVASRISLFAVAGCIVALASAGSAKAVTVDFDTIATGQLGNPYFTYTGVSGTTVQTSIQPTFASTPERVLLNSGGGDFQIDFVDPVNNLSFDHSAEEALLTLDVSHSGGIANIIIAFDGDAFDIEHLDLSAYSLITSIAFDVTPPVGFIGDTITLDTFVFDVASPIPLPAAFPLFVTAIGGMGLMGWRRKRKAACLK